MRRFLIPTIGALLVASLAWGQFKGVDVRPGEHRAQQGALSIPISGAPAPNQKWGWPLAYTEFFPSNFVGVPSLDGISGASCGTNNSLTETYLVKVNGVQIGTIALSAQSGALLVQQATPTTGGANTLAISTTSNVTNGNTIVIGDAIQSNSGNPMVFSKTAGTSTIGTVTYCPTGGNAKLDSGGSAAALLGFASVTGTGSLTITATVGGGLSEGQALWLTEFSGVQASPLDVCGGGLTSAGNAAATPLSTGTTTQTGTSTDLIIGEIGQNANGATLSSLTAGFSPFNVPTTNAITGFGVYENVGAIGNYVATGISNLSGTWAGIAMALKANGTAGCTSTFATTGGKPWLALAGQRFELDAPANADGADIGFTLAGHQP